MKKKTKKALFIIFTFVILLPIIGISISFAATQEYYTYTVKNGEAIITDVDNDINGYITVPSTLGGFPVTSIGDSAFLHCFELDGIIIPESVTSIGDKAFYFCNNLDSITLPDSITSIGKEAFYCCNKLESIILPNSLKSIEEALFYSCDNLESVTIPDSVTAIGDSAFSWCDKLESITIPDSVTSIGKEAFHQCSSLENISIGSSLASIGNDAFKSCKNIKNITVDKNNNYYTNDSYGALFNKNKTELIQYPVGNERKSYVIPDSVTNIGKYAFNFCDLTQITIPDSVIKIENYAFNGCVWISDIYYTGTQAQWENIDIDSDNEYLSYATIHYNYCEHKYSDACDDTCNICGAVRTVKHSYTSATCTTPETCTACGKTNGKALGHDFSSEFTVDIKESCTSAGSKSKHCSRCNATKEITPIPATGHKWDEWKVIKTPDEKTEGIKERTCSVCNAKETKSIEKLPPITKIIIKPSHKIRTGTIEKNYAFALAGQSVADIKKHISTDVTVFTKDGKTASDTTKLTTGMQIVLTDENGNVLDTVTIIVPGDVDGDGLVKAADARRVLRAAVNLETLEKHEKAAADLNAPSARRHINSADARYVLRAAVGLDSLKKWLKKMK